MMRTLPVDIALAALTILALACEDRQSTQPTAGPSGVAAADDVAPAPTGPEPRLAADATTEEPPRHEIPPVAPVPPVPPVPFGLPEPPEPPEPPDLDLGGIHLRVTEEGIFGPGIMITEDGIIAPGISITKDGLRFLDDENATVAMRELKERLGVLGKELRKKLEGREKEIRDKVLELEGLDIEIGDIEIDLPELVLKGLRDHAAGPDSGPNAMRTSCAEGDCSTICVAGQTCKASCAGGGCRQVCQDKATCNFTCAGGECNQRCEGTATCSLTCAGGGCRRTVAKTAMCKASCAGDDCSDAP